MHELFKETLTKILRSTLRIRVLALLPIVSVNARARLCVLSINLLLLL